jgi:hypothetical protein
MFTLPQGTLPQSPLDAWMQKGKILWDPIWSLIWNLKSHPISHRKSEISSEISQTSSEIKLHPRIHAWGEPFEVPRCSQSPCKDLHGPNSMISYSTKFLAKAGKLLKSSNSQSLKRATFHILKDSSSYKILQNFLASMAKSAKLCRQVVLKANNCIPNRLCINVFGSREWS